MIKHLFFASCLLLCGLPFTQAQESLSGTVKIKGSDEPIANAAVFIDNTTVETTTDADGNFKLEKIPDGFNKLVIGHQEYKTYTGKLRGVRVINIQLTEDPIKKELLKAGGTKSKKWKRLYQQFEKAFLGYSDNAKQSRILNPEILEFERDGDGSIWGYSVGLLKVENQGTGYMIHTQLDNIQIRNKQISFIGNSFYSELEGADTSQKESWNKKREKAYLGSKHHFLYALKTDQLDQLGYEIYKAEFNESGKFKTLDELKTTDIFVDNALKFDDFLRVVYTKSPAEASYRSQSSSSVAVPNDGPRGQVVRGGLEIRNIPESDLRVSYLFNRASKLVLNDQAQMRNPEYLLEYGYWNWERLAENLPIEYHIAYITRDQ